VGWTVAGTSGEDAIAAGTAYLLCWGGIFVFTV